MMQRVCVVLFHQHEMTCNIANYVKLWWCLSQNWWDLVFIDELEEMCAIKPHYRRMLQYISAGIRPYTYACWFDSYTISFNIGQWYATTNQAWILTCVNTWCTVQCVYEYSMIYPCLVWSSQRNSTKNIKTQLTGFKGPRHLEPCHCTWYKARYYAYLHMANWNMTASLLACWQP